MADVATHAHMYVELIELVVYIRIECVLQCLCATESVS
jgi:hypothetical protein